MRIVDVKQFGPPEVLQLGQRSRPEPAAGDVLIKVAAAGVNRADLMQRQGHYPPPPGAPDILGLEVSGTIAAVGPAVSEWQAGDEVCALLAGGGYAEYVAVPASVCLPVPKGVALVDAAAIPETACTVWTNVFERAHLAAGEVFLCHGGSSGIGTMAMPLAHALGARVFATAGSPEKCAACERLGAERAINYRVEDFVEVVRTATGGRGADVILDMVGAAYLQRNLSALNTDGRLVIIGMMSGAKAEIDLRPLVSRRLVVTGSALRPRTVEEKAAIVRSVRQKVLPLIEAGKVPLVVHARYPLADAAEAHRVMEGGTHIGKLLLVVSHVSVQSS